MIDKLSEEAYLQNITTPLYSAHSVLSGEDDRLPILQHGSIFSGPAYFCRLFLGSFKVYRQKGAFRSGGE